MSSWPKVPEILDHAAVVEAWHTGRQQHVFYRDRETRTVVKIHGATWPILRPALLAANWTRTHDWRHETFTRPEVS